MAGLVPAIVHVLLETGSDKKTWMPRDILRKDALSRFCPGMTGNSTAIHR
jgi:hypothetical protein